ncbi:MAG TPA: hypothetical protein VIK14_11695 [Ignavibacteria bacterium]
MLDENLNQKRIRDHAPYRKSLSLTEEDMQRISYLEKEFTKRFPSEIPFSFSKTISKSVEFAFLQVLMSMKQFESSQQSGQQQPEVQLKQQHYATNTGKPKKFQKTKRGF